MLNIFYKNYISIRFNKVKKKKGIYIFILFEKFKVEVN